MSTKEDPEVRNLNGDEANGENGSNMLCFMMAIKFLSFYKYYIFFTIRERDKDYNESILIKIKEIKLCLEKFTKP